MGFAIISNLGSGRETQLPKFAKNIIFANGEVNEYYYGNLSSDGYTDGIAYANAIESGSITNSKIFVQGKSTTTVVMGVQKPVNFNNYSSLKLNVSSCGSNSANFMVYIVPTKDINSSYLLTKQYGVVSGLQTIDVSSINTSAYVVILSRNDTARYVYVDKLWLE